MAARGTLLSLIEDLSAHPRTTAYIHRAQYRRHSWTYAKILAYAKKFAVLLDQWGMAKGDKLIIWGQNSPEWIVCFLGCIFRGIIIIPIDDTSTEGFVLKIQKIVRAKIAVFSRGRKLDDEQLQILHFDELEDAVAPLLASAFVPVSVMPADTAEIVFTSGTTAEPKGVIISHRNIMSNLAPIERYVKKYGKWVLPLLSFRFLLLLPLSHMFGQALGIFIPIMMGRTVILMNSLNPDSIARVLKEEKAWIFITVPRILDTLRDHMIREYEKRGREFHLLYAATEKQKLLQRFWAFRNVMKPFGWRFRCIVVGGAALSMEMEEFWSRLGIAVVQGYGLTETAPIISINNPLTGKKGSIGRAVGDQQIKVGEDGEILVRGSNVTEGYLSESGIVSAAAEEGWFRTGDLGEVDDEGYIFFRGRKKDVIVTAEGMNVFPEDVESVLNQMTEVKESVVVSVKKNGRDEVHAVLLLKGTEQDPANIVKTANERLSPHQRIRSFSVWKEFDFPRTPTLKIKRREVAASLKEREDASDALSMDTTRKDEFTEIIRKIAGKDDIEIGEGIDLSSDLGMGSIERVELLCALEEKYQIHIDEREFSEARSIKQVKDLLRGEKRESREIQLPRWALTFPVRYMRIVLQHVFFLPFTRLFCPLKVEGKQNLPEGASPFIIVSNHISFLDTPVILRALPFSLRRRVTPLMMQEFFNDYLRPEGVPFYRRFLVWIAYFLSTAFFGGYPFPTEGDYRKSMEYTGEVVSRGFCPLIFPEGERTETGKVGDFKHGIGMMVMHMKIPVLPIRLDGLQHVLPIDRYWPKYGKVSVRFGPMMTFKDGTYELIAKDLESVVKSL